MSRLSLLAGPVAFLAISGVNAGPCRPSSSVISSGLETATASTEVSVSTATLTSTLTAETEVSETLSAIVSTTEVVATTEESTTAETTAITVDTTTTEAATSDAATAEPTTTTVTTTAEPTTTTVTTTVEGATTTEAPTTTAETTTALATTSAGLIPEPLRDCYDIANPYVAPNGDTFNIDCNTDITSLDSMDLTEPGSFEACMLQCSMDSSCRGVEWHKPSSICVTFSGFSGTYDDAGYHIAVKVAG